MKSMRTLDVIGHAISLASATSRSNELRAVDGALPPFDAGAHLDVHLGPSLVRQHSLCNSPRKSGRYLICGRREHATAQRHVQVAGGIGITPLLSMAEAPTASGDEIATEFTAEFRIHRTDRDSTPLARRARRRQPDHHLLRPRPHPRTPARPLTSVFGRPGTGPA